MNMIRTIIADDEPEAAEGVKLLLERDPEIDVLAICKNGIEVIDMINSHEVDLMFLDIQMPLVNGMEVINSVDKNRLPFIVFVTAYDQYAVKAFEIHAADYLLKPFTNSRFYEGLKRAKELVRNQQRDTEQNKLKDIANRLAQKDPQNDRFIINASKDSGQKDKRFIVKENGTVHFLKYEEIIWIEAFDYYVKIHLEDKFILIRESLKKMEAALPSSVFLRIHKSTIVNLNCILQIDSIGTGEYLAKLTNGHEVKVSRTYKEAIKKFIG